MLQLQHTNWFEVVSLLKRKAYQKLLNWKKDSNHKALCIFGARQIGKTTLIRKFGKENYKNFVEINFISDTDAAGIFSGHVPEKRSARRKTAAALCAGKVPAAEGTPVQNLQLLFDSDKGGDVP